VVYTAFCFAVFAFFDRENNFRDVKIDNDSADAYFGWKYTRPLLTDSEQGPSMPRCVRA
jgi:hypothetical protein